MKRIVNIIDRSCDLFGLIAGIFIVLSVTLVLTEVVMRTVFSSTTYIAEEYSAYFMVSISFFSILYAFKEDSHIRITFIDNLLKEKTFIYNLCLSIIGLLLFALITYSAINYFWDSVVTGSRSMQVSRTYLAIPQFAMPLASLLITLQFFSKILKLINNKRDNN